MIEYTIVKKIRELRLKQNLKIQDIADRSGLSKRLISKIENNKVSPPIATLVKISNALGIHISYFFQNEVSTEPVALSRKRRQKSFTREIGGTRRIYEPLALELPSKKIEPFVITITNKKGKRPLSKGDLNNHNGEEFIYVLEGKIEHICGTKTYQLEPGDSIYFNANVPHLTRPVVGKAKYLAVLTQ
jgi:transcriptional regulator with XRE-family HTH domain